MIEGHFSRLFLISTLSNKSQNSLPCQESHVVEKMALIAQKSHVLCAYHVEIATQRVALLNTESGVHLLQKIYFFRGFRVPECNAYAALLA